MQASTRESLESKLDKVGKVLRLAGWISLVFQVGLGAVSLLTVASAIVGRNFNQATTVGVGVTPAVGVGVTPPVGVTANLGATPGLEIGIFWAIAGILALLIGIYFSYRQTRFAKRLCNADRMNPSKSSVMTVLRLAVIVGLVGMLLTILGEGATLGVLFAKTISQPLTVGLINPARFVRSTDMMVALANITGITAHFTATVTSLAVFEWLRR